MEAKVARIFSFLFHPLLIPTYAMLMLLTIDSHYIHVIPDGSRWTLFLFVVMFTFVLPGISILVLLKLNVVKSLEMKNQSERPIPLVVVAVFFYASYYLLRQLPVNTIFNIFILVATLLVLISLLVNYIYKISIHMVALGGLLGTFVGFAFLLNQDIRLYLYCIIIAAGITGTSRLLLKAHSPMQIYTGFLLGLIPSLSIYFFV